MKLEKYNISDQNKPVNTGGVGLSSKADHEQHVFMSDLDETELIVIQEKLSEVAEKFNLNHFILATSSKDSYHLYNLQVTDFKEQIEICRYLVKLGLLDEYWMYQRMKEWKFVLRITNYLGKKPPEIIGKYEYDNETKKKVSQTYVDFFKDIAGCDLQFNRDVEMEQDSSLEFVYYEKFPKFNERHRERSNKFNKEKNFKQRI